MSHFDCPECPDQHDRIAALEAQVAALAGFVSRLNALRGDLYEHGGTWEHWLHQWPQFADELQALATADATHLARLDAARREVCAAAEQLYAAIRAAGPGTIPLEPLMDLRAAVDALAKLEGQHG